MIKRNPLSQTSSLAGVIEHRGILGAALSNLGTRIVGGEWSIGDAISKEADLCEELGVSRSVVRETFRILGAKGLIRSRTSDGTRVQPRARWRLLDPDVMDWRIKAGDTNSLLEDLLKVRLVLEPGVAYTATNAANDEDRAEVKQAWDAKVATFEDVTTPASELRQKFIETDLDFHRALIGAVRSELLDQLFSIIEAALELLLDLQMRAAGYTTEMIGMDKSHELHEQVFIKFMAKDAAGAEIAMRELIKRAIEDAHQGFELLLSKQKG
ncbi:MAG: FadR family transcriptional regulator [Rhizobiales bacterium]|nr:FCD domain-containing protein [Hyphomicrobiales bacterium]NRB15419.1 FadR family transcriptional regulator [Hyphomicrobiales bacterium]